MLIVLIHAFLVLAALVVSYKQVTVNFGVLCKGDDVLFSETLTNKGVSRFTSKVLGVVAFNLLVFVFFIMTYLASNYLNETLETVLFR